MKYGKWGVLGTLGVFGTIVACSGTSSSAGGQYDGCLSSQLGSSCIACVKGNCPAALGNLENGCSDLFACICPGGNFSASNAMSQTCTSKAGESSCVAAQSADGGGLCAACESTCAASASSSSGGGTGSSSGSINGSSGGGGSSSGGSDCGGSSFLPGTMALSLTLTGIDFGDMGSASEWETIGWNLDDKCTTSTSRDVCSLYAGASFATQNDGSAGLDNSYGENICAILDTLSGVGSCSSKIPEAYLQLDATGSGMFELPFGTSVLAYPVRDVHVNLSGAGGVIGGVFPTTSFVAAWQAIAGCISTSLCSGAAFQSIATQLEQASDINADGTNNLGTACDGISFGLRFTGSSPLGTLPPVTSCACQ